MKRLLLSAVAMSLAAATCCAASRDPNFKKLVLSDQFYAEGAYYADFNKDGNVDVVAGPFWYEGPNFEKKHAYREGKTYDPHVYSDNFMTFAEDFNGDGWKDILVIGMPGDDAYWYENPAGKEVMWKKRLAAKTVGNESPSWGDVNGDGQPDLLYNIDGYLGYGVFDPSKPEEPWVFHPITTKSDRYQRFTHGIGCGDINGDGRTDMIEAACWWEQPANAKPGEPWIEHPFKFADWGAQMWIYDIDGDKLNDVLVSWHCHHYGMVWYKQIRSATGEISWEQHEILSPNPDLNSDALRISQLHAQDLADFNGDGLTDFVTGKRFWAHGPEGDKEPSAPCVLYWFELQRDKEKGAQFIPHKIDDNSGVGTQVCATDLNNDKVPDIIVSNKKGTFLFLSQPAK